MAKKRPRFQYGTDFDIGGFGVEFDFVLAQSVLSPTAPPRLLLPPMRRVDDPTYDRAVHRSSPAPEPHR